MHIRTFRAASLQDALEDIRRQMGDGASVLYTRQVREGWMGWLGKTSVEVTAGLRDDHEQARHDRSGEGVASASQHTAAGVGLRDANRDRLGYPLELQDLRSLLLIAGVDDMVADRWIESTYAFGVAMASGVEPGQWIEYLRQTVARGIRIAGPIHVPPTGRRVVALVGPTGVGKTTTIAKLAAGFRLEAKRRVALVTIDTFRIAAVQQLQAYAEIMDLPMEVVQTPEEMQPALQRLEQADLVLIDTAGRSPRSDARIEQLRAMLRAAQPDETHLVLSATSSRDTIQNILDGFSAVRPTAAILSKLDESTQLASVLAAFEGRNLPISYITTGQQVPDDIETADAESLVGDLLATHLTAGRMSQMALLGRHVA
jgi:flagellar biosynthesis protein FlhF